MKNVSGTHQQNYKHYWGKKFTGMIKALSSIRNIDKIEKQIKLLANAWLKYVD